MDKLLEEKIVNPGPTCWNELSREGALLRYAYKIRKFIEEGRSFQMYSYKTLHFVNDHYLINIYIRFRAITQLITSEYYEMTGEGHSDSDSDN